MPRADVCGDTAGSAFAFFAAAVGLNHVGGHRMSAEGISFTALLLVIHRLDNIYMFWLMYVFLLSGSMRQV